MILPSLSKAVNAKDFAGIARTSDYKAGPDLVDHEAQARCFPEHLFDTVHAYKRDVLDNPEVLKPSKPGDGATKKLVYSLSGLTPPDADGVSKWRKGDRYIVKPYHEKIGGMFKGWMKHNILGWAEMTNQALYHAAGLGHIHQNVHVADHPTKDGMKPMLVIKAASGMEHVFNPDSFAPEFYHDMRKVNIMDFLTNNMDRHGENMLYNPETNQGLAIDHGRSFQYFRNYDEKWNKGTKPSTYDAIRFYLSAKASRAVLGAQDHLPRYPGDYESMPYIHTINEWWPKHSTNIRAAMKQHLQFIKDPAVANHIWANFNQRAGQLDQMAEFGVENFGIHDGSWADSPVPFHDFKR